MEQQADHALRERLVAHLKGGEAFIPIEKVLEKIEFDRIGDRPKGFPYSFYELFWHTREAQRDLLEYARDPFFKSPSWPDGYWPEKRSPGEEKEWEELKTAFFNERESIIEWIRDPENDLTEPFSNGSGHTLFRQALLVIEHTAYHNGQLLLILRALGLHS